MTLYSYCIPFDNGAAPNPFWGFCTLAICKPVIRRNAKVGDWIVATGSITLGLANRIVYAMEVKEILTFPKYNEFCKKSLKEKIPDLENKDPKRWVGDCIYDFKEGDPILRNSVHHEGNVPSDLGGLNVLLSDNFYYFGSEPVDIPNDLLKIVRKGQGHKSLSNEPFKLQFLDWILTLSSIKNKVTSTPYGLTNYQFLEKRTHCGTRHCREDEKDEELECLDNH